MTLPERSALFIDGSNFHATTKLLNLDIDYLRLLDFSNRKSGYSRLLLSALPDPSEQSTVTLLIFLTIMAISSSVN